MIFYIINWVEAIDQKKELLFRSDLTKFLWALLFTLLIYGCSVDKEKSADQLFEILSSDHTGIDFKNQLKDSPELNILSYLYYYNGAGVASADFNNDGLIDLYFTGNQVQDKLYLNKGNFQFDDITEKAGINNFDGWTSGVTIVDINNDGLLDI